MEKIDPEYWYTRYPDSEARDELVKSFQLHEIRKRILDLQPDNTLVMDPNDALWKRIYRQYGMDFKELVNYAAKILLQEKHQGVMVDQVYKQIPIEFRSDVDILVHDLHPRNTDKPVTFNCTVISIDARKTYLKNGVYVCPRCETEVKVVCDKDRRIPQHAVRCNRRACRQCQMTLDNTRMSTDYIQTVIIQEPLDEAKNNSPVSFVAKLVGNQVGEAFVSQKKRITGVFKSFIDTKKIEQDIYIDIIEMESLEEKELTIPTNEQIEKYKEESRDKVWMDKLISNYAPHIYGYHNIKMSILLMLAGGVQTNKRGDINLFLIGDPSMAKTELLKFGEKVTQKSAYTTGKGASGVGLTIAIIKEENLGRYMATAGIYPLCNGGFVFVDEFDKMNKEDRSAMHEVLEHGMCSVAKAGIKLSLPAKVGTLAAANPKYGKYDTELTVAENIDLPPTLLSRFDMIWLIRDKVNELEDEKKAKHVLHEFEHGGQEYESSMTCNELKSLLNYVRKLKPSLCPEASDKLLMMYKKMRKAGENSDSVPVGIRQLEALVRLSMAHAKWHLRDTVTVVDIDSVINLYKASYKSYNIDLDEGTLGNAMITDFANLDKEQAFWHKWNECADKDGKVNTVEFTDALAGTKQFPTDLDVNRKLYAYEYKENKIMRSAKGLYTKV